MQANTMVDRACLVGIIGWARGCNVVMEALGKALVFHYTAVEDSCILDLGLVCSHKLWTSLVRHGS